MSADAVALKLKDRFRLARFLRGEGPQAGPITLTRRRVFILPNRFGLLFVLVLLVLWMGAINYNNGLAYVLTFLLGALSQVSILHTYRNLAGLTFSAGRALPVFAGEQAQFVIRIDNPGGMRHAVTLRTAPAAPVLADVEQHANVTLTRATTQRGYLHLGRFTVSTVFPLGMFRAWSHLDLDLRCLVYPHPAAARDLPPVSHSALGDYGAARGADDYSGLRAYQPGDSLRHVHWKSAARNDVMLVKQFDGGGAQELWLDWHTLPHADVETRLSILCRWVLDAHAAGCRYGLRLPEREIAPANDERHRQECLTALALFGI